MSDEAIFILVEDNVADTDCIGLNGFNRYLVAVQYGGIHAVAGCSKTDEFTGTKKIGNQLRKYLCMLNPDSISISVRGASLEERFTWGTLRSSF